MLQTKRDTMRPLQLVLPFLVLLLTPVFTSVGEDAQVIRSSKSVLTIYSYGKGEGLRFAPELPEQKPSGGALTDVVASPPLSSSVPLPPSPTKQSGFGIGAVTTTTTNTKAAKTMSGSRSMQAAPTVLPVPPAVVSLAWQPSSDQTVVGYNLYIGTASGHYTTKQSLGNQIVAQLPANQQTLYLAVSAYTAEGLESALSDELALPGGQDTSTTQTVIRGGGVSAN